MNSPSLGDEFDGIELDEEHSPKPPHPIIPVSDALDLIKDFDVRVQSEPMIVWRGERCLDWKLRPSLFRSEPKLENWSCWGKETALMCNFEKSNAKWVRDHHAEGFIERLTLAQHHGLPTRLLDWTESPFIALFLPAWIRSTVPMKKK